MTKTYFPFDSGAGAASYETNWRKMARLWRPSGPINGALNGLLPYGDSTGMQVKVPTGQAWIDGFYFETDITYTLAIATADATNPRIDVVVLRLDMSANTIDFGILTGTAAVSPTAPSVTQGATIWEIALAQVRVDAAVVTIAAGKVTDVRQMSYSVNDIPAMQVCAGRLTLTSGTPVTTSDVTAAATLYFTPYMGNKVALYDTTQLKWAAYGLTEISLSLSGYTAGKNYDIFLSYNGSSLVLDSVVWTSDTVRATALAVQDGVYVKTGDPTHRYIGTIRTTATIGQTEDSLVNRLVYNYYNRTLRKMYCIETTSHAYNGAYRKWNNSDTNNLLAWVMGMPDLVPINGMGFSAGAAANICANTYLYIDGVQSSHQWFYNYTAWLTAGATFADAQLTAGYHYCQVYEFGNGAGNNFNQSAIHLDILM